MYKKIHKIQQNNENYTNPYDLSGLLRNYCLWFYPKLFQVEFAIRCIPFACNACIDQVCFSWKQILRDDEQPRYKLPKHFFYSNIFFELNAWNIITFTNKYID